jgi:hypothetical protein
MQVVGTTSLATFCIFLINRIFPSHVYSLTVGFIADSCRNALPLMHALSRSLRYPALFPFFPFDIKKPGKPFHPIIVLNKLFQITPSTFHLVCSQFFSVVPSLSLCLYYIKMCCSIVIYDRNIL